MSDEIAAALRAEPEIGFGTVKCENGAATSTYVGFVITAPFDNTDSPCVTVIATDDDTPHGTVTRQTIVPMHRVINVRYDREQIEEAQL